MKEIRGNIFAQTDADAICVTTNGIIKQNGELVMGAGIAKAFKEKFPFLPRVLGKSVGHNGNHVYGVKISNTEFVPKPIWVLTIPTKNDYRESSPLDLIEQSIQELVEIVDNLNSSEFWDYNNSLKEESKYRYHYPAGSPQNIQKIVLPRPGCAHGGRDWETEVKPILEKYFDDRFYIITP